MWNMKDLVAYTFATCLLMTPLVTPASGMFQDVTNSVFRSSPESNPVQLNYGVAVTDVDNDGQLEVVVAGYNGPNLVLKYNQETDQLVNIAIDDASSPFYALRDVGGQAIGVSACDVDGDGMEEIYFLNTNNAYSGMASYSDKLFKFRNGKYVDLLSDDINQDIASYFAGRSVACVDRTGNGRYAIYLANYAKGRVGPHSLIEMDEMHSDVSAGKIALKNVAREAGIEKLTGGRGVTVGPILNDKGYSDVFCVNEHGPNFLFKNQGNGRFTDVATNTGVSDAYQHGRGVMLTDFNGDEKIDIVYGNWNGPHRIFLQREDTAGQPTFMVRVIIYTPAQPLVAVFDNDCQLSVLLNNIAYRGAAPNKLFTVDRGLNDQDLTVTKLNIGDAEEKHGRGTGGTVTDLDGDGVLEVILSHGESAEQPLSVYKLSPGQDISSNGWLRVQVLTSSGAPARGAKVTLHTTGRKHSRVIDAGSGYLCQMEPVAHFGLGQDEPTRLEVVWPDSSYEMMELNSTSKNIKITVNHPRPGVQALKRGLPVAEDCQHGSCIKTRERSVSLGSRDSDSRTVSKASYVQDSPDSISSLREDLESSVKVLKRSLRTMKDSLKSASDVESLRSVIRSSIRMLRKSLKSSLDALKTSQEL
ncbi:cartilage acidic protein 1-like [Macrobrachium rosenbergii]|uniref:cartilage acidic protein 1-like n=1 Tax=Macrobrachium rosenbergii TaxID=79674 RepID=UPI0034D54893